MFEILRYEWLLSEPGNDNFSGFSLYIGARKNQSKKAFFEYQVVQWWCIYRKEKPQLIDFQLRFHLICAQNKTRTCTPLPAPAPQAGVSTNFTIWAIWLRAQSSGLSVACPGLCALCSVLNCSAQNRTRTCTSLLTLVPETSASTNFAIWAYL